MVAVAASRPAAYDLVTVDGGKMRLHLHRGQQRAWRSRKRFVCIIAGSQSGKTSFGPHWLRREIQERGPGDYMVVSPTFPLLEGKTLPEFKRLFEQQLGLGKYKASPVREFVVSANGERRLFGAEQDIPTIIRFGYAADPDSLESVTAKGAWLDECGQGKFKLASWEAIQRRLALHQGRALMTTTPYNLGWLYSEIWKPWNDARNAGTDHPYIDVINFDSTMNPAFTDDEFERIRTTMPPWRFDLFHRGIFTRPAGMIYGSFREESVIDPFPIPDHWPRYMGNDFGGVNTAALYAAKALDGPYEGKYVYYREYLAGDRSSADHAREMLQGEPVDPETGDIRRPKAVGGAPSENQWRTEFRRAGLPIARPPIGDVEVGITKVYGFHAKRKVVVFRTLSRYLEQMRTYVRPVDANGNVLEGIEDKETFHLMDTERYLVSYIEAPRPEVGMY